MEIVFGVEWVQLAEIITDWASVIRNDVNHDPNLFLVSCLDEGFEVLWSAEIAIQFRPVFGPVSMVAYTELVVGIVDVFNDWRDPNCIEAHTLDVIKLLHHALVVATAVLAQTRAGLCAAVIAGKPVCDHLVDASLFPRSLVAGMDCHGKQSATE